MKAKVMRGAGFRGTLNYVLGKDDAEQVAGILAGTNGRQLAHEFGALRQLRPDIERPVWHVALSLPPGESLSSERWATVVSDFMGRMGFNDRHGWTCWRHRDTAHDHVHIVASRIAADGSVWLGRHDVRKALQTVSDLEVAHGLQTTKGYSPDTANLMRIPTKGEIEQAIRTHEQPIRMQLQSAIDNALSDRPSLLGLVDRLEAAGISVRFNMASTGRISGVSFEYQGVAFKASGLGKQYGWNQLQQRIDYDQERDHQAIAEHCAGRRCPNAAPGIHHSPSGPIPSSSHQPNRDAARCDGSGLTPRSGVAGPDDPRPDGIISDLESHNRRRQRDKKGDARHVDRATGSGAVARIRLAEIKASRVEIQPRGRPVVRGARQHLTELASARPGFGTADCDCRHASPERPNYHQVGSAATTSKRPIATLNPSSREANREHER
jgi:hypothetical protein